MSSYGDVYSFGILLLEMFTGKRPTDDVFKDNLNLHTFVKTALYDQVSEIVDFILLREREEEETMKGTISSKSSKQNSIVLECLTSVLEIGVACSAELPSKRMKIGEVESELRLIKENFSKTPIHEDMQTL